MRYYRAVVLYGHIRKLWAPPLVIGLYHAVADVDRCTPRTIHLRSKAAMACQRKRLQRLYEVVNSIMQGAA